MTRRLVLAAHPASYPDPIAGHVGDGLVIGRSDPEAPGWLWCRNAATGREGWVPDAFLGRVERHGTASLRRDYDAVELDAAAGEWIDTGEEVAGWA